MTDPNFERSLRAAARRGQSGGVHPDASLLAAYVDRGLSDAERVELEAHVADCAVCMERLALLGSVNVPDEPETPSFEWSPRQFLSRWGWLVPVATVVVLVAVWERQPSTPARAPAAPSMAEEPAAVRAAPSVPQAANKPAPTEAREEFDRSADVGLENEKAQKAPARQIAQAPKAKDASVKPQMQAAAREASPHFGTPPPAGGAPEDAVTRDKKQLDSFGPVASKEVPIVPAPPPAAAPAPAQAEAAAAAVAGRADEAKPKSAAALKVRPMPESIAQGALLKSEVAAPVVLATRDTVMIRLLGTRLERSTDEGATWTLDLQDAPAGLHAGSCPTTSVCWIGGARGMVLLRHDSGSWTRHVVADGRAAVATIEATDALAATVRLSDGRSFRTADGGATWVELPGSRQ